MTRLLRLDSISKSFGSVHALNQVSFDLMAGEVHALLGENGAGKSTLIKMITGAHPPDRGRIEVYGNPVSHLTPASAHRLGIACIYQQPALFPDLTISENIGLRLEPAFPFRRINWRLRNQRAGELLTQIGADIPVTAEVRSLSMPEQQLVEIACAIGAGARIVIMDEPTAALTQKEQQLLFTVVRKLRHQGAGIIYISHRLDEIFELADRVTVLRDGVTVGCHNLKNPNEAVTGSIIEKPHPSTRVAESELVRQMIGRELSQTYPPLGTVGKKVVLSLKEICCAVSGIHDITLDLHAGEVLGIAGLVGAGRTELARVLFGITPADHGEILLNGHPIAIRSPKEAITHGIVYVPEDRRRHGVILQMAIDINVTLAIHPELFPWGWIRFDKERAVALRFLKELSVKTSGPDAPASELSGGNQQKIALARWLATTPKVLILDEPTQGVDVGAKSEIHGMIRNLADNGMAVLMISSDLPEVLGMSDRIAVVRGGTVTGIFPGKTDPNQIMAAALGQAGPGFNQTHHREISR